MGFAGDPTFGAEYLVAQGVSWDNAGFAHHGYESKAGIENALEDIAAKVQAEAASQKTYAQRSLDNCAKCPHKTFLTQPMGGDEVLNYTFSEFLSESKKMAAYIESLNLPVPSQIAIMSKNCAWWPMADLAIMMTGHIGVPIYPTLTAETTKYTLEHSEAKPTESCHCNIKNGYLFKNAFPQIFDFWNFEWKECISTSTIP